MTEEMKDELAKALIQPGPFSTLTKATLGTLFNEWADLMRIVNCEGCSSPNSLCDMQDAASDAGAVLECKRRPYYRGPKKEQKAPAERGFTMREAFEIRKKV